MDEVTAFVRELFKTPAFYTAALALAHSLLFYFVPAFPREIVVAADGLVTVIASVWTGKVVESKRQSARIAALEEKLHLMGLRP